MTRTAEGRVRGLGTDGDGAVVVAGGAVVLVRGVLPGERVRLEEIGKGRVRRGRLLEVIEKSAHRVPAPCGVADRCGGCPLMIASPALAAEIKRERVGRALAAVAPGIDVALATPDAQLGYRRRARLAFAEGRVGYRAEGSRNVVDVASCLVLAAPLAAALDVVRARVAPHLVGAGEIRLGASGDRGTVRIESRDPQPPAVYAALDALVREGAFAGAALLAGGATAPATFGAVREATVDSEGRALVAPLGGFGQAHAEHNRALAAYAIAAAAADGKRVLELYAGHGNFTLSLAARAAATTAVELDAEAARCLRENVRAHGLSADVVSADAARAAAAIAGRSVDVVFLDPPRTGAADAIAPIVALAPPRVVYVSCDPESLARDAGMLVAAGFRATAGRAFDMFPQTSHVEVVLVLERASAPKERAHP